LPIRIKPQRRRVLGAETGAAVVARAQAISERRQRRCIEANAGVEIADFQSDVVVHDDLRFKAHGNARLGDQPIQCRASRSWKILRLPREEAAHEVGEIAEAHVIGDVGDGMPVVG
jgi:hypothetical protein